MILTAFYEFMISSGFLKGCEIFSLVTFAIFLVLQIFHHRAMWYYYIPSCMAAGYLFFLKQTWAMGFLNVYYMIMGVIGIIEWRKDHRKHHVGDDKENSSIILHRMPQKVMITSIVIAAIGIPLIFFLLRFLGDPYPVLDSITTTLSIIATWWLTKSYIQQFYMWIIADIFAIGLNASLGYEWLVVQFILCIISSCLGAWNWKRHGEYSTDQVPDGYK